MRISPSGTQQGTHQLLSVSGLSVRFPVQHGPLRSTTGILRAVEDVSFKIAERETLGLVGESGCGKTTLARAVVRLTDPFSGKIEFDGEDITGMTGAQLRRRRRKFQMIFQDPFSSLNPRLTIEQSLGEGLDIHRLAGRRAERKDRVAELLIQVGLGPDSASRYPHEFSGGQRQRIGIARALALDPKLIVCDEPVAALDVSVQAQVVNLLREVQERRGVAYLFIAHDLALVEHMSHRVMVMYLGRIVELAAAQKLISSPKHPYTEALISAVPDLEEQSGRRRIVLPGEVPSPLNPPLGCPFHTRCPRAEFPKCSAEAPAWRELSSGHWAACHFAR